MTFNVKIISFRLIGGVPPLLGLHIWVFHLMVWILRTLRKIEVWSHARLVATLRLPISGTKLCLQLTWAQWPWPLRQSFLLLPFNHLVGRNPMMPPVDTSHRHWPEKKRCFLSRHRFFCLTRVIGLSSLLENGVRWKTSEAWAWVLGVHDIPMINGLV